MAVTTERIVGEHTISTRRVQVQAITWRGQDGTSYDLLSAATGETLTDESWDAYPTEEQMTDVLREQATEFCRFCEVGIIGNGHLIGAAERGTNPWCCDDCWDPRLS